MGATFCLDPGPRMVNLQLTTNPMEALMNLFNLSSEGVWTEIYRRAVRIYRDSAQSFDQCLESAKTGIQIEMDMWIMCGQET